MTAPLELRMPDGVAWPLSADLVADLEAAVRAWNRQNTRPRGIEDEIETYLSDHPAASALEIARGIRARDHDVRAILINNPRFTRVTPPAGCSRRVKTWILAPTAPQAVPENGIGGSAATGEG